MLLIVEDEPTLRESLASDLFAAGFEVATAQDGNHALVILNQSLFSFTALVTDIRLGAGPDGWEVARHAREVTPNIVVVYVTGDCSDAWASKGVPGSVIVTKPYASARLVAIISTLSTSARKLISASSRNCLPSPGVKPVIQNRC